MNRCHQEGPVGETAVFAAVQEVARYGALVRSQEWIQRDLGIGAPMRILGAPKGSVQLGSQNGLVNALGRASA